MDSLLSIIILALLATHAATYVAGRMDGRHRGINETVRDFQRFGQEW